MDDRFTTKTRRHQDFMVLLRVLVPLWSACRVNGVPPVIEGKIGVHPSHLYYPCPIRGQPVVNHPQKGRPTADDS